MKRTLGGRIFAAALTLAVAVLTAHCSPDPKATDGDEASPSPTDQSADDGTGVQAHLDIRLVEDASLPLPPAGPKVPTYLDAQPILQAHCASCHHSGGQAPDLSTYPAAAGALPSPELMDQLAQRVESPTSPMPPSGRLPAAQRDLLAAWARAGGPAAPKAGAPDKPAGSPTADDLSQETLVVRWGTQGTADQTGERCSGASDGAYSLSLGQLAVGSELAVNVEVTDAAGTVLVSRDIGPLTVPESGDVQTTVAVPKSS